MCRVLSVSRSAYYEWHKLKQKKEFNEKNIQEKIKKEFKKSKENYGSPRITTALKKQGVNVSKSTVYRQMAKIGIAAKKKKKFMNTTDSNHNLEIFPNVLNRNFDVENISEYWVGDITYIRMNNSWLYLTTVIDLADRMVIGWSLSTDMTTQNTVLKAFENAVKRRKPKKDLLFHSDRGVQYASKAFREIIVKNGCRQSMSRKGNCWDNAVAESFFKTIKVECIYKYTITNQIQAYSLIFDYIDGWYNTVRIHSSLDGKSPLEMFKEKLGYIAA